MESDSEYKRALNKALVLIGHNDRTAYEVKARLIQNGFSEDTAVQVTEYLINERYINDRRYAEYYVVCYSSKRSISRIRRELISKGIDKDIVDDVLDECDDTEAFYKALEKQLRIRGIRDKRSRLYDEEKDSRLFVSSGFFGCTTAEFYDGL